MALTPLRSGLRDLGQDFAFFFRRASEMVFGQSIAQELESVLGRVDDLQQIEVPLRDGAGIDKGLEIDDAFQYSLP